MNQKMIQLQASFKMKLASFLEIREVIVFLILKAELCWINNRREVNPESQSGALLDQQPNES